MKYRPKWIEDNLGIKRSTLRVYEKHGLLPHRQEIWREYTEEELNYIWTIKVLTGIGFSHKELREAFESGDLDIRKGLSKRLSVLEAQRDEIERNIRYLKEIKQVGRIPAWPRQSPEKYEDFQEAAKQTVTSGDANSDIEKLIESFVELLEGEPNENAFLEFMRTLTSGDFELFENPEELQEAMNMNSLLHIIASKRSLDPNDSYVQALVRALYEVQKEMTARLGYKLTPKNFARRSVTMLTGFGDNTVSSKAQFGAEGCEYAAKAIAIFAGYEELDEVDQEDGLNLPNE